VDEEDRTRDDDERRERKDVQKRAEPEQPPVDGPSAGSSGEPEERDLGDTSYGAPDG
jgi:hypothetical protein